MPSNFPWSSAIKQSFYYSEYYAYGTKIFADGIMLQGWKKYNNEAYDSGKLYIKYEWILPIINTIRGVPKDELAGGIRYGDEWERHITLKSKDTSQECETHISFINTYYEKSSPRLEISIYSKESNAFERNSISISHGYGIDGYTHYVEPILAELEKYVPQKEQQDILKPIGKTKTELEIAEEHYINAITRNPARKKEPYLEWIKRQVDDTHYEITALVFRIGRIEYQKVIILSTKTMAMIKKYMSQWLCDDKTLPYKLENPTLRIEIFEHPQYKKHMLAKILIKSQNDIFEIPFMANEHCHAFHDLCNFTEADKIYTSYLRGLHGFVEDDYFVLKWYPEYAQPTEENAALFLVSKHEVPAFVESLKFIRFKLMTCLKEEDLYYHEYNDYEYYVPNYTDDLKLRFFLKNKKIHFINNSIQYESFPEDFFREFNKLFSLVMNLYQENQDQFITKDFDRILWKMTYDYAGQDTVHYIVWQFENSDEMNCFEITKEKLFKIQLYSSWWWRSTDHSKRIGFEDDELFFEINPVSDRKDFGTVTLELKKPDKKVKVYFDLSDGSNLPKSLMEYSYDTWIIRKVLIKDNSDLISLNWWDSKYSSLNDNTKHFSAIKKCCFEEFRNVIKELFDFLNDSNNHVADLLSPETAEKYDREDFWVHITPLTLATNCDTNLTIDEDIPLDITFHPRSGDLNFSFNYIPIIGTRELLLFQLQILLDGLKD